MKIVVCVRQAVSGEINPFDAAAYEAALRISGAEVILLSMGPTKTEGFLKNLTRLGAKSAYLLCDSVFAGSDTLATAYTLSLAIERLKPDVILCGRQTVDGDTGQVGPELSVLAGYTLVTNVMELQVTDKINGMMRSGQTVSVDAPVLCTMEKNWTLRLPSIRSKEGEVIVWDAKELRADLTRCGLNGSPTKVMKSFENEQDRRRCTFIEKEQLSEILKQSLAKAREKIVPKNVGGAKLSNVWIVGKSPEDMARTVSNDVTEIALEEPEKIVQKILEGKPEVVLWGSDAESKKVSAQVAAVLQLGLCADCTALETDGETLYMYRPAFSGNIIAKIRSTTRPQMATVRTLQENTASIVVGAGMGVKGILDEVRTYADRLGAELAASRPMVDHDYLPYEKQVGLTGKTINPDVYLALGISGAIHHIAGIRQSQTIIAVNPDQDAAIFDYADYGVVCKVEEIINDW